MNNKLLKEIHDYIIAKNVELYNDIFHISNPTLSRNPYISNFLDYYLKYKPFKSVTLRKKTFYAIKYYFGFYVVFFIYLLRYCIYNLVRTRIDKERKFDYLLDVNFLIRNITGSGEFKDNYLKRINTIFKANDIKYAYIVKSFLGSEFDLINFTKMVKILNASDEIIFSEYDLLEIKDLLKVFVFANIYPIKLISICTDNIKFIDKVFNVSNIESLNGKAYRNYIRYLTGIKIGQLYKHTKLISFCEYKCHDKLLYKGIKDTESGIFIYGCQFFIDYPVWLNTKIPEEEKAFNVTPDVVVVNGKIDLKKHTINSRLGASLRYEHVFSEALNTMYERNNSILILLPFLPEICTNLLEICSGSNVLNSYNIIVRFHPALNKDKFPRGLFNDEWLIDNAETLDNQLAKSDLVIVSGSGTALEAVCKNKSVIIVKDDNTFLTNPLSDDIGKGVIWDVANTSFTLDKVIEELYKQRIDIQKIIQISQKYKELYFINPTEENVLKFLELRD